MRVFDYFKDRIQGKAPKGAKRSSQWRKVREKHIKENPRCAICGLKTKLEVHHKIPFHYAPDLELEIDNLVTLCENKKWGINCHLLCHRGNYSDFDPNIDITICYLNKHLGKYEKD